MLHWSLPVRVACALQQAQQPATFSQRMRPSGYCCVPASEPQAKSPVHRERDQMVAPRAVVGSLRDSKQSQAKPCGSKRLQLQWQVGSFLPADITMH